MGSKDSIVLSGHASKRSGGRSLPAQVIRDTVRHPFVKGHTLGLQWSMSRAVLNGVWRFVMVVWRQLASSKVVVTAYPVEGHKRLGFGCKFAIGLWETN